MSVVVAKPAVKKPKTLWQNVEPFVLGGASGMVSRAATGRADRQTDGQSGGRSGRTERTAGRQPADMCSAHSPCHLSLRVHAPVRDAQLATCAIQPMDMIKVSTAAADGGGGGG